MFPGLYTVQYRTMYSTHSIHCKYSVKKNMEKTRHFVYAWKNYLTSAKINTFWLAISIHRRKTVLLLQQCTVVIKEK